MSNPGWLIVCKRCGKGEVEGFWLEQCEFWDGKEMATATVTHWTGKQDELWREACPTTLQQDQPGPLPTDEL